MTASVVEFAQAVVTYIEDTFAATFVPELRYMLRWKVKENLGNGRQVFVMPAGHAASRADRDAQYKNLSADIVLVGKISAEEADIEEPLQSYVAGRLELAEQLADSLFGQSIGTDGKFCIESVEILEPFNEMALREDRVVLTPIRVTTQVYAN